MKKIKLPVKEIVEKYENGTSMEKLAREYGTSDTTISSRLKEYYKEKGKKALRILKSLTVIEEYLRKGIPIEEIIEIATKRNIIIPKDLINTALKSKEIKEDEER